MIRRMPREHRLKVGQICVFTNRGSSGITKNDGKKCEIRRCKPRKEWASDVPEYVIEFMGEDHGFGCLESELESAS